MERMLYERAIRTKIRPPKSDRFNRIPATVLIAEAMLAIALSFTPSGGNAHQQNEAAVNKESVLRPTLSMNHQSTDGELVTVAMSQMGR